MHPLLFLTRNNYYSILFVIFAILLGWGIDSKFEDKFDEWIHDTALSYQSRTEWHHTATVVLDDAIPYSVGRKQALPLFALATERLIKAGVSGVYLDARVSKEMEKHMPYAACIHKNGEVKWSRPTYTLLENSCQITKNPLGNAPFKISASAIKRFSIAPYLDKDLNFPDFLLYGWEASQNIPAKGLQASDRLVTKNSSVARWLDLSKDSAIHKLISFSTLSAKNNSLFISVDDEICNKTFPCRRIRLGEPIYKAQPNNSRPVIPLSKLASCAEDKAMEIAKNLNNKLVVFQLSSPTEQTDRIITPVTTAWFSSGLLTPGAQFIVDGVETVLNKDHPRAPSKLVKLCLFSLTALLAVLVTRFKPTFIWFVASALFSTLIALCFFTPLMQLWPVFSTLMTFLFASGAIATLNLFIGLKEGKLIKQYMPSQIHDLLFTLNINSNFQNKNCQAIVLMSDLSGYTTITSLLKEPELILSLMNDYLSDTSIVLQKKYNGWFESYVGDMVCYYWPFDDYTPDPYNNAVLGAIELAQLQRDFFASLPDNYQHIYDEITLTKINTIINAGIGLCDGNVVMGDLGPKNGIRKFGILGDPLNLASRVEGLTRLFTAHIIVTGDMVNNISLKNIAIRRLGKVRVKGRLEPVTLFALDKFRQGDPTVNNNNIISWEKWLTAIEQGKKPNNSSCPEVFSKDMKTILEWKQRNLLDEQGTWNLDEK